MGAAEGEGEGNGEGLCDWPDPLAATVGWVGVVAAGDVSLGKAKGDEVIDGVRSCEVGVAEGMSGVSDPGLSRATTPTNSKPIAKTARAPAKRIFKFRPFPTLSTSTGF